MEGGGLLVVSLARLLHLQVNHQNVLILATHFVNYFMF